jgi:hypothetical protein
MGVMERRSASQIREKYADMFAPALLTNWKVWPIAQVCSRTLSVEGRTNPLADDKFPIYASAV